MISLKLLLIFICAILFSSCATMYTGNKGVIHFSSEPQQASVIINGKKIGTTPLTVKVKRTLKKRMVTLKKEGYESSSFKLEKKFVPISVLSNVAIPIDAITGAIVKYKEHFYNVPLKIKSNIQDSTYKYNLNDNFYVITKSDTLFTDPINFPTYKTLFGLIGKDVMDIKLINGKIKHIPLIDIIKFKTLEIYQDAIGALFLSFQIKTTFHTKIYINTLFTQKKNKNTYMFMEDLIDSNNIHLVRAYNIVTQFNSNGMVAGSSAVANYFIYIDGQVVSQIKEKDLLKTIELNFTNEQKLITLLKKKNKFKILEKYLSDVYNEINKVSL